MRLLRGRGAHNLLSSSMSSFFCVPFGGYAMLSCSTQQAPTHEQQFTRDVLHRGYPLLLRTASLRVQVLMTSVSLYIITSDAVWAPPALHAGTWAQQGSHSKPCNCSGGSRTFILAPAGHQTVRNGPGAVSSLQGAVSQGLAAWGGGGLYRLQSFASPGEILGVPTGELRCACSRRTPCSCSCGRRDIVEVAQYIKDCFEVLGALDDAHDDALISIFIGPGGWRTTHSVIQSGQRTDYRSSRHILPGPEHTWAVCLV